MTIKLEASKRLQAFDIEGAEEGPKSTFTFVLSGSAGSETVTVDALDAANAWIGLGLEHKDSFTGVKTVTLKD